ncbi:MAG TPA: DUF4296 domain-containing protein [Chitinophagaceae bacterium]|nr:DUF4296 domain-containing protein [Chitinophagaceae bacterium]
MRAGWLIWAAYLFLSCKGKDHVPADVLSREKMQVVLTDMMRADQFLTDFVLIKDTSVNKENESIKLYQQVFSIHKISREEFQRSFEFYRSHPSMLKNMMDSIGRQPGPPPQTISQPDTTKKKFIQPTQVN